MSIRFAVASITGAQFLRLAALALVFALAACGKSTSDAEDRKMAEQAAAREAVFAAEQKAWRDERVSTLTQPEGWTSLIGLHWIDPGSHYLGSDADNGIRLAMGPAHLGLLHMKSGHVRFVPERGAAVTLDGAPLTGSATLRVDDDPAGPSKLGFDEGKGVATVIKRGDRYALRVKHADAPTRTGFKGIDYWPLDAKWQVPARFIAHPPGKTIAIANIIGTTDEVPNPGVVEFERDGKTFRLEALDEGDNQLFLVFADRTSGHGSYGAGRFLYAALPDAQGRVMLDFNHSYNPPCAFTSFATCPLPPPENRLDLAVNAGEKSYSHSTP